MLLIVRLQPCIITQNSWKINRYGGPKQINIQKIFLRGEIPQGWNSAILIFVWHFHMKNYVRGENCDRRRILWISSEVCKEDLNVAETKLDFFHELNKKNFFNSNFLASTSICEVVETELKGKTSSLKLHTKASIQIQICLLTFLNFQLIKERRILF